MNSVGNNVIVRRTQNPQPQNLNTSDPIGTNFEAIRTSNDRSELPVVNNNDHQSPPTIHQHYTSHPPPPPPPPPAAAPMASSSRGQVYDPTRTATITITAQKYLVLRRPPVQVSPGNAIATTASASPSIASLINPPSDAPFLHKATPSALPTQQQAPSPAQPTQANRILQDSPVISQAPVPMPLANQPVISAESIDDIDTDPILIDDMDIDPMPVISSRKTSTSAASAASPLPVKQKEKPTGVTPKLPPLPGQGYASTKASGARAIVIDVPLNGARNQYVNFHELAVQKYGFDAVWPKLAIQRDHLARVAANAAALERKPGVTTSNDDMSIDGSDNEAELSASSKRRTHAGIEQPVKKKRLTYEDMYDKDDPFVDDTEMAWEEKAAAVKDGFFVYSGLLVPSGGEASIEK